MVDPNARVGQWPAWKGPARPPVVLNPDAELLGHEFLLGKEIKKYKNIAGHYGTLMRHKSKTVRNALRNQGCPEPEATWIARAACGKRTQ